uniref:Gastrin-releasing peptide n=1 Tax=Nothobranchius kuhntae TaxID=321403 RepID=A0A1A8IW41_NOTKU
MGGVCRCYSWTCRPLWPLFMFLAAAPGLLLCSENPAEVVGKMYPRGNHWAVGHLMGKKSIKSLPEQQETNSYSLYLTPSHSARISERDQQEPPLENLPTQRQRTLQRLFHSIWREVDGEKHLQEMSNLLLLALKLQENTSL